MTTNSLDQLDPGKARFDAIKAAKREEERQKKIRRAELQRSRAEAVRIAYNRVEEKYRGLDAPAAVVEREKQREASIALAKMFPRIPPGSRVQYHDRSYLVAADGSYRREGRPSKAERRAARQEKRRGKSS